MSTVTQAGRAPVPMDTLGIDTIDGYDFGDGPIATINRLIAQLQKIGTDMRDLERQFAETMQRATFDRQVMTLQTKRGAIDLNFKAALASGTGQILGGVAGVVGAATGSQIGMSAGDGLSKAGQGIAGVVNANMTLEAQQTQLRGDFEEQSVQRMEKSLETTVDRAADASRQMRDVTRDLVSLHERVASAVRF